MANLITLSRLLLLLVVVVIAYRPASIVQLWIWPLLSLVFISDGLDGWIARRRGEESLFGALFDIAVDRIVELTLWIVLADLDLVPIWIPVVFVVRGGLVDAIRASGVQADRRNPLSLLNSPVARWLVGGRFMRGFYGSVKGMAFVGLFLIDPLPLGIAAISPEWALAWVPLQLWFEGLAMGLAFLSVALCLLRGLPVILEFLANERRSLFTRNGQNR
ncbi:CDP-alcohol phosphatidyltransferase family protein [Candidatus Foliamicus sp.]